MGQGQGGALARARKGPGWGPGMGRDRVPAMAGTFVLKFQIFQSFESFPLKGIQTITRRV